MTINSLDKIIEAKRTFDKKTYHNLFIIKNNFCWPCFDDYVDECMSYNS